ncbi:TadE-like protein [compost metagenome]|uniref:Pilus assembly protein n=1 Tax=Cupriavidus campinensis TaxID=151783 RepID=A0AAE9I4L4_9BURK|nr:MULTISPECIES: TadE/TadG family type IV pilus assembly protein [Cupriavidus]TSP11167.1 pilus assembly protein [Cupriavidus campinensis]URF07224.1 pilus assembly protein [Cupriavidus campinensis]CAG2157103.1 hypothetical protein LMG19282_05384 [Cupriavidus campinensis]
MSLRAKATRRGHLGVAALEFAIVFPLLLTLVLGIVYYGMVLALQQVLTLAAEEGARAALRYPLTSNGGTLATTIDLRVSAAAQAARATLPDSLATLVPAADVAQAIACSAPAGTTCVRVTLNLPTTSLLPSVPLVPVPATLTGSAVVQISPDI